MDGPVYPKYRLLTNGNIEVVYRRRLDADLIGLEYIVQRSTNLLSDSWTDSGTLETGSAAIDAFFESVTNVIDSDDTVHGRVEIELSE